jgi:tRNA G46 methylase TrmB
VDNVVRMGRSDDDRQMVKRQYQDERHADYHTRQFEEPYRSTVHLCSFVKSILGDGVEAPIRAIDIGCGGGANIYHLGKVLPKTEWVGIDWADQFFDLGRPHIVKAGIACEFIQGDFY